MPSHRHSAARPRLRRESWSKSFSQRNGQTSKFTTEVGLRLQSRILRSSRQKRTFETMPRGFNGEKRRVRPMLSPIAPNATLRVVQRDLPVQIASRPRSPTFNPEASPATGCVFEDCRL